MTKYLTIGLAALTVIALIHEWGFYHALGLNLAQSPIGVIDQFKVIIGLTPSIIFGLVFLWIFLGIWVRFEDKDPPPNISAARILAIRTTNYRYWGIGAISFGLVVGAIGTIFPKSDFSIAFALGLFILGLGLSGFKEELAGPDGRARTNAIIFLAATFLPLFLFSTGEFAARRSGRDKSLIVLKKPEGNPEKIAGQLLRSYEHYTLIRNLENKSIFVRNEDIGRIEVEKSNLRSGFFIEYQ